MYLISLNRKIKIKNVRLFLIQRSMLKLKCFLLTMGDSDEWNQNCFV